MQLERVLGVFRATIREDEGVIDVVATGEVTPASFMAAAELYWVLRPKEAVGTVFSGIAIDLRQAYAANGNQPIGLAAGPSVPRYMRELPAAIIAPQQVLHHVRDYAMACAMAGAVVGGFTSRRDALGWLLERARALAAQRARLQTK